MQKAGQSHPFAQSARLRLFGAADTVLTDRPEGAHVAVSPADEGERVRDILYTEFPGIRLGGLKLYPAVCSDIVCHDNIFFL